MTELWNWLVRNKESGEVMVAQFPNPAIWVFVATLLGRWSSWDALDTELRWIGMGALIVWAADELTRGDAPIRRILGAVVLSWQLWQLFAAG